MLTDHVICPCREVGNGGPYNCYCFTLLWQYVYSARFNCIDQWKSIQWKVVECLNRLNKKDKLWKNLKKETNNENGILKLYFCVWRNYCLRMLNIDWLSININAEEFAKNRRDSRFFSLFPVFTIIFQVSGGRACNRWGLILGAHLGLALHDMRWLIQASQSHWDQAATTKSNETRGVCQVIGRRLSSSWGQGCHRKDDGERHHGELF